MFHPNIVEKIKTHIFCLVTFSWKLCRLWGNVEKYCRAGQATDDKIIQHIHFACWITKGTDTHSEYAYCSSKAKMVTWTCLSVTLYVHFLSC